MSLTTCYILLLTRMPFSKRAFQTQFKRWGFPSKQNPAHKNEDLVTRVKQLWESNTAQRDMLRILNEEGFHVKERELMRVRAKNRWLLRVPNGMKLQAVEPSQPEPQLQQQQQPQQQQQQQQQQQPDDEGLLALQQEVFKGDDGPSFDDGDSLSSQSMIHQQHSISPPSQAFPIDRTFMEERRERLDRLRAESAQRWAAKKRRRRTRGWAGLPADPPGPPRFPSETTIDESKRYLDLGNSLYRDIRDQFQRICAEAGFIKKTVAGPERWQAAKNKLIDESPHLRHVFQSDPDQLDAKTLALDVVCTDVTKRMRTLETRMTIADAKNIIGVNPEESRQIRNAFYNILKSYQFTSKLEGGDEHWEALKDRLIEKSDVLKRILSPGAADSQHTTKVRALEVLCRDVIKRLHDDQSKRTPSRKQTTTVRTAISNTTTATNMPVNGNASDAFADTVTVGNGISTLASQALASAPMVSSDIDMQIDPSLNMLF